MKLCSYEGKKSIDKRNSRGLEESATQVYGV